MQGPRLQGPDRRRDVSTLTLLLRFRSATLMVASRRREERSLIAEKGEEGSVGPGEEKGVWVGGWVPGRAGHVGRRDGDGRNEAI